LNLVGFHYLSTQPTKLPSGKEIKISGDDQRIVGFEVVARPD
jgi:hypothetical protein